MLVQLSSCPLNLYETEFFEDVKVSFNNNLLTIDLKEYPIINQLIILGEKSNFDGEKRIKELERQLKDTDDIIKAMKIKDKIDDINRVLLESMFIIVVPNIKKDLIVPMNKLYEEVGIYVDFFPIKFESS